MIELTTGVAFLLTSMYGTGTPAVANTATALQSTSTTTAPAATVTYRDRKAVEKYLQEHFMDTPLLYDIARCESTFSQYDKTGKVLRGIVNNQDIGVMQINEKYHADSATKLGLNIHTIEGNVAYAKHLYREQGAAPWKASSKCWANS